MFSDGQLSRYIISGACYPAQTTPAGGSLSLTSGPKLLWADRFLAAKTKNRLLCLQLLFLLVQAFQNCHAALLNRHKFTLRGTYKCELDESWTLRGGRWLWARPKFSDLPLL